MTFDSTRRSIMRMGGLALAAAGSFGAASRDATAAPASGEGQDLKSFSEQLAAAPRRRNYKTVPALLDTDDQWDHEALALLFAYAPKHKQVWDVTEIGSPWLKLVRNSLNAEVVSFRHPDFLAVVACHGSAQLALYDEATWDKYQLAKLTGDNFKKNVFIEEKGEASDEAATIPALMKRGVVFTACHNAVWEQTSKLLESGVNPDKLSHGALAAEMTNHLVPGVVLNPGAVATILEAQLAGYHYIR